jgi:hypothetical protein
MVLGKLALDSSKISLKCFAVLCLSMEKERRKKPTI